MASRYDIPVAGWKVRIGMPALAIHTFSTTKPTGDTAEEIIDSLLIDGRFGDNIGLIETDAITAISWRQHIPEEPEEANPFELLKDLPAS